MTPDWHTSTYSGGNGCIQARWVKSTRSSDSGNCVEVARPGAVHIRDSKDPAGPILTFAPDTWMAFIATVKGAGL